MQNSARLLILVLMLVYFISPIDLIPGSLIDDLVVAIVSFIARNKMKPAADIYR